jgi:hypothetical protein
MGPARGPIGAGPQRLSGLSEFGEAGRAPMV